MPIKAVQIVAPVGGWNARDALDQMPAEDAVTLTNWFPTVGRVETRRGFQSFASGLGSSVETLVEFNAESARKLLAAANGKIFDVSNPGLVGAPLGSGFQSNRWSTAQFDDVAGGPRIGFVNGVDTPQIFNGTSIASMTLSGTGLTPSNIAGINVFKSRSYFWEVDSQDFWYSDIGALGGTLSKFPLGRVSGFGGNIVAMASWTLDGGDGVDDLAVFVMSSGDVIIYSGSNPGSASDWSLVGIFRLGAPLSQRGVVKIGSDLVIMTKDGYVPLSKVLATARSGNGQAISDKISGAIKDATNAYSSNFGWQAILYPKGNYVLFNVPVSGVTFHQHVVNTLTGAWTKFEGMDGACWSLYNDRLYFGCSDGTIYLADKGFNDNGADITFSAQTAWNYLGLRGQIKRFSALKPVFQSEGSLPVSLALAFDFETPSATYTLSEFSSNSTEWETSPWDTSAWADKNAIIKPWVSVAGIGLNASARVFASLSNQSCQWYSLEYLFDTGGII